MGMVAGGVSEGSAQAKIEVGKPERNVEAVENQGKIARRVAEEFVSTTSSRLKSALEYDSADKVEGFRQGYKRRGVVLVYVERLKNVVNKTPPIANQTYTDLVKNLSADVENMVDPGVTFFQCQDKVESLGTQLVHLQRLGDPSAVSLGKVLPDLTKLMSRWKEDFFAVKKGYTDPDDMRRAKELGDKYKEVRSIVGMSAEERATKERLQAKAIDELIKLGGKDVESFIRAL